MCAIIYSAVPALHIPCRPQSAEQRQAGISDFREIKELEKIRNRGWSSPWRGQRVSTALAGRPSCLRTKVEPGPETRYTRSWTVQRLVFEHHLPGPKPFSREKQTVTCWEPQLGAASKGSKSCFEHKPSRRGGCTSLQQAAAKQPPCSLAFNNISARWLKCL